MKRFLSVCLVLALLLSSLAACNNDPAPAPPPPSDNDETPDDSGSDDPPAKAEPMIHNMIYSGEITTLNYLVTASENEFAMAANMVDTLICYDQFGIPRPMLAESWSSSEDQTVWTFNIRPGVKWYTFQGEEYAEVVAQDWVDAMNYILNPDNGSSTAQIAYSVIKNARDYYEGTLEDFEEVGVKAVDKYTLEYTLSAPTPYFLSMLNYVTFLPANGDFLAESAHRFGTHNSTLLYNGAYILEVYEPQNRRVLVKNENYWDAANVFIERINYRYNREASAVAQELYLRGELTELAISSAMLDEWMNNPERKAMVRPGRPSFYTFFFALNFKPEFDAEYEPANWEKAVNNTNFRKSLFHAINRMAVMMTHEPFNPQNRLLNTITPFNFVSVGGKDFTQLPALAPFTATESFNAESALSYKEKAMEELAGTVTFPVKIKLPYNSGSTANADRAQVLEQQLENLLGKDYIDVMIVAYPPTGYLNTTRRAGNYALQEVNWGPDYADPQTYTDPFATGSNYNFPEFIKETDENGVNLYEIYEQLIEEAQAEVIDIQRRYELFAQAEGFMIENAWVIPLSTGGGGYFSSKINPFEAGFSPFGLARYRYVGVRILDRPMNTEEYYEIREQWEKDREEALRNAAN